MQVRLTTDRATSTAYQQAGEVVDLPEREALRLIASGGAEPVEPEAAIRTPERQTATIQRPRARRK